MHHLTADGHRRGAGHTLILPDINRSAIPTAFAKNRITDKAVKSKRCFSARCRLSGSFGMGKCSPFRHAAEMNTNDHFHVKLYNSYRVKRYPTEIASLFSKSFSFIWMFLLHCRKFDIIIFEMCKASAADSYQSTAEPLVYQAYSVTPPSTTRLSGLTASPYTSLRVASKSAWKKFSAARALISSSM